VLNFETAQFISLFFLPPASLYLWVVIGLFVRRGWPRTGFAISLSAALALVLLSFPTVTGLLIGPLQKTPPLSQEQINSAASGNSAIVVLGGGRVTGYREYGDDTVNAFTLERVRYAAWLKRRTQLPLLVSGGRVKQEPKAEATLMQEVLQKEFLVQSELVESSSRNTYENALFTAKMLERLSIKQVYLVTHAWHMPRAAEAFTQLGIKVIPAPTAYYGGSRHFEFSNLIPDSRSLYFSSLAIHEYIGRLWYKIRYFN
jgi:uncharacterized SAM-binding protein YcdF (DUF218 family)